MKSPAAFRIVEQPFQVLQLPLSRTQVAGSPGTSRNMVCSYSCMTVVQDLYPAWAEHGMDWIVLHGQEAATHNQTPATQAVPPPQDLMLSPEQLQLVTDYFQKVR